MIVQIAAILLLLTVLFAAPLVLGAPVVAQGADRRIQLAWLGLLTGLLVVALGFGALAAALNGPS